MFLTDVLQESPYFGMCVSAVTLYSFSGKLQLFCSEKKSLGKRFTYRTTLREVEHESKVPEGGWCEGLVASWCSYLFLALAAGKYSWFCVF